MSQFIPPAISMLYFHFEHCFLTKTKTTSSERKNFFVKLRISSQILLSTIIISDVIFQNVNQKTRMVTVNEV